MFAGHYAIGLAIKARHPRVPALPILLGVVFFDILAGLLAMLGVDAWARLLGPGAYLFMSTILADGSHAFVAAALWSVAWGALFLRRRAVAGVACAAAFSHFVVDWSFHAAELSRHPHAARHLALGVGSGYGLTPWLVEGGVVVAALVYAACCRRDGVGMRSPAMAWLGVLLAYALLCPLLPWMGWLDGLRSRVSPVWEGIGLAMAYAGTGGVLAWWLGRGGVSTRADDRPAGL